MKFLKNIKYKRCNLKNIQTIFPFNNFIRLNYCYGKRSVLITSSRTYSKNKKWKFVSPWSIKK